MPDKCPEAMGALGIDRAITITFAFLETLIDLMHDDIKQCFRVLNAHCGSLSHERIQYGVVFPRSGIFKWQ